MPPSRPRHHAQHGSGGPRHSSSACESGETGRRVGFRFRWGNPWGFDSPLSHHPAAASARMQAVRPSPTGTHHTMAYTVRDSGPWQRSLTIEVPPDDVERRLADVTRRFQQAVSLPGFRKGKVPLDRVRQDYAAEIEREF